MKKNILFIFGFIIFFLTNCNFLFAQNISPNISRTIPGCPYVFSKNLQSGATDPDILVMQQILNSDKRTIIAYAGPGSAGQETNYFGRGTRGALKRFQALFIEFIGVADGKVGLRTREVMQSICTPADTGKNTPTNIQPLAIVNSVPLLPLQIVLSANTNLVAPNSDFKIIIDTNKEIKKLTPDVFIIDGGIIKEIRKLGKQQYLAIITANSDAKSINLQIEADKVTDKDNLQNQEASNEIIIGVTTDGIAQTPTPSDPFYSITQTLSNLLQQTISNSPATPTAVQTNSQSGQQSGQQPQQQSAMSMISQMLSGLLGGGGGSGGAKGQSGQAGSQAGNGGQQQTASGPAAPSDLEKAKAAAKTACESESLSGTPSSDCIAKTQTAITEQAKSDAAAKSCGELGTNETLIPKLKELGIEVDSTGKCNEQTNKTCTSMTQMPNTILVLAEQIKKGCGCDVTITGGTEVGHLSHNVKQLIFDLRDNDGLRAYLKANKLPSGVSYLDETSSTGKKTEKANGSHWHIDGSGLCKK